MDESERLIVVAAVAPPEAALAAWRRWKESVPIADATAMLTWAGGYVHRNLAAAGVSEQYLTGIYRHNFLLNMTRLRAALPMLSTLSARWPITPLKGFGMSGDAQASGLRPIADVDIWLPMRHLDEARSHLRAGGFSPLLDVDEREFRYRIIPQRGSWNYLDQARLDIDLHWRLIEHLDDRASRRLVDEHSSLTTNEFGAVRRLDDELMLCCLVAYFKLDGVLFRHGLFDVAHLMRRVDPQRTAILADRIGVARETVEVAATLRSLVGVDAPSEFAAIERALAPRAAAQETPEWVAPPRFGERIPERYHEAALLARPRLYRLWTALGRPAWMERLVCRLGGFTRVPGSAERASEAPRVYPTEVGILGPGWHYRYPGADYRWANLPDARVLFRDVPASARLVRISLSPGWPDAGVDSIEVRGNGRFLGVLQRAATGEFTLPRSRLLELSLRPAGDRRYIGSGVAEQRSRLLTAVRSIELV